MDLIIETERMFLSPVAKQDVEELHHLWAQPAVRKYLFDDKIMLLSEVQNMVTQSTIAFSANRYGIWIARLKNHEEIIGFTGYWTFFDPPEVQLIYGLAQDYWGKGLAMEMARSMLDYGFQTYEFDVIRASADVPNTRSIALMKRLGMTFEKQVAIEGQDLIFYKIQNQPV